ncbi:hypothetical protein [Nisaea sediminum]|uniref:hypothetical protein n=1 Tax=Nisaea sediminum TaxID=2775867 RepID=UPI001866A01C|nr:hypothetical protein [Nisaea sediminum]
MSERPENLEKITLKWMWEHISLKGWGVIFSLFITTFAMGSAFTEIESISKMFDNLTQNDIAQSNTIKIEKYENELIKLKSKNEKLSDSIDDLSKNNTRNQSIIEQQEKIISSLKKDLTESKIEINNKTKEIEKIAKITSEKENEYKNTIKSQLKTIKSLENDIITSAIKNQETIKSTNIMPPKLIKTPQITAKQIQSAVDRMNSFDVDDFLIYNIPKLENGIECNDLASMLSNAMETDSAKVVTRVSKYIRRPLSHDCIDQLSATMMSTDVSKAITVLLENN